MRKNIKKCINAVFWVAIGAAMIYLIYTCYIFFYRI